MPKLLLGILRLFMNEIELADVLENTGNLQGSEVVMEGHIAQ